MWTIANGPEHAAPLADHSRFRYVLERDGISHDLHVAISGTVMCSDPDGLPDPVDEAAKTLGRSEVEGVLHLDRPPDVIEVLSDRIDRRALVTR
jgi:hypothetical protein